MTVEPAAQPASKRHKGPQGARVPAAAAAEGAACAGGAAAAAGGRTPLQPQQLARGPEQGEAVASAAGAAPALASQARRPQVPPPPEECPYDAHGSLVAGQLDKEWAAIGRRPPKRRSSSSSSSSSSAAAGAARGAPAGALTAPPIPSSIHIPTLADGFNGEQHGQQYGGTERPPPGPSAAPVHGRSHHVEAVQSINTTNDLLRQLIGVGRQIVDGESDLKKRLDRFQENQAMTLAVPASQQSHWNQAAGKQQHDKEE